MLTKHYKNISNYFSVVEDVGKAFEWIMNTDSEAVFGVEAEIENNMMELTLITPPYIRLGEEACTVRIVDCEESFACYEGYLVQPHFLPLYGALNGLLMNDLENLMLIDGETVALQWLFRKRSDNWKPQAIAMYSSFLEGNEDPFHSKIGRTIQDKILGLLNKMSSFDMSKPYIEEVEKKLLQDGYQFQLRVIIRSQEPQLIKDRLVEIFKKYDSHNAIRLLRVKPKRFVPFYRDAVLTYDTNSQILSRTEVASLFGGKAPTIEIAPMVVPEAVLEKKPVQMDAVGLIELLPYYPREVIDVNENIVTDIAEAMKRAGIVSNARLYNPIVTAGVRLTVVQTDIPNGKTLTQLSNGAKDIQAELGVLSLGIEQGESAGTVKFTIPNEEPAIISLRELIELASFREYAEDNDLAFIVGVDEINNPIYLSLTKLVHLLVAGTTGSGKSVFINTVVVCLIANNTPEELRLIMIDPKQVEMQHYEGFPHVREVITDMEDAEQSLAELVDVMEARYTLFKEAGVKNIKLYNQKTDKKIPYIVCVIDEYADLKDTHPQVEEHITRLGQKARAAGIHMIIATQRPDTKVISGRIKANVPNAISFNLNNNTNYKTVFGRGIPYSQLLGRGDGVMKIEGYPKEFQRFQSAIISPDELLEEEIFTNMKEYLSGVQVAPEEEMEADIEEVAEENLIEKLKNIILTSGETKVEALRKELGVKTATITDLMNQLVEEGFLIKHKSRAKGYELANESENNEMD
jgi:S-DNA-T family DNA segregation ATPase FtsK/SpoIIIE